MEKEIIYIKLGTFRTFKVMRKLLEQDTPLSESPAPPGPHEHLRLQCLAQGYLGGALKVLPPLPEYLSVQPVPRSEPRTLIPSTSSTD